MVLPRNWVDIIFSCFEITACCTDVLSKLSMLHKRQQSKRQELFRQYDFHREDIPLRHQLIGELYKGPLLAQSLVSKKKSHFNLKFVSQLVMKSSFKSLAKLTRGPSTLLALQKSKSGKKLELDRSEESTEVTPINNRSLGNKPDQKVGTSPTDRNGKTRTERNMQILRSHMSSNANMSASSDEDIPNEGPFIYQPFGSAYSIKSEDISEATLTGVANRLHELKEQKHPETPSRASANNAATGFKVASANVTPDNNDDNKKRDPKKVYPLGSYTPSPPHTHAEPTGVVSGVGGTLKVRKPRFQSGRASASVSPETAVVQKSASNSASPSTLGGSSVGSDSGRSSPDTDGKKPASTEPPPKPARRGARTAASPATATATAANGGEAGKPTTNGKPARQTKISESKMVKAKSQPQLTAAQRRLAEAKKRMMNRNMSHSHL